MSQLLSQYSLNSYPSIYSMGHANISELLLDSVIVEEKIDGSQFSWGKYNGVLKCRSKGVELDLDHVDGMFKQAVEAVFSLSDQLHDGWTYRAEYLQKSKHNTLAYSRIPNKHLILFDVNTGNEAYLTRKEKEAEAARLGLEIVPVFYEGMITSAEQVLKFMEQDSYLGGCKIEGMVIKNYSRFGKDKKVLLGKYVSEAFKEQNGANWKGNKQGLKEFTELLIEEYKTEARWRKAVQHLNEAGQLTNTPKDIGLLIKEVGNDILKESLEEIKEKLYKHVSNHLTRGFVRGLPEWYKNELLKKQF